ncbi:MAG: Flp family type IVb pilin [Acidimicrobiia bacterium]|nr:Flp family type IVb pilin [Acidimicrobiia bacterium]
MPNAADSTLDSTDRGASLVEYALLLALIAVVCVGAMSFLGGTTGDSLSTSTSKMFVAD